MKIAILSMQKVVNYGSFMQSFALRKTIESFGHECEYLDVVPGIHMKGFERSKSLYIKKFIERFMNVHMFKYLKQHRLISKRFQDEFFDELGVLKRKNDTYDMVVIGSDEVFNFAQPTPWGFTEQLYGKINETDKVISYAGSFGHTTIAEIEKYGVKDKIKDSMGSMKSISVRDKNSFGIVEKLLGSAPTMNVDPVFIYDFSKHIVNIPEKDYIIIYTYPSRISGQQEIDKIVEFAKKYNKKLISIGFFFPWCDEVVTPHPFEVLSYIKNADYVITDTFHGTIFSIITNSKFGTLIRNTNTQKLTSLLETMKRKDRIINDINNLEDIMLKDIDYSDTKEVIKAERQRSLAYLKEQLS
ncbi:polysaccharide pyruvyl transferase family protein [Shewanella sp. 10N.7]|uniref:polysaccharide pyruvyl transferase family protein n=1 Tax=Shewanella sp. 10N.7 TaxID=2885093 RepID=UPI001E405844|nr:polysaccharide pyruvyl transferase family protein [Shewanella sp. 10N.7]MCC4831103.1 polysaccharide pyruvyl transferase family protein [Shewanella sp. 10N.7]